MRPVKNKPTVVNKLDIDKKPLKKESGSITSEKAKPVINKKPTLSTNIKNKAEKKDDSKK